MSHGLPASADVVIVGAGMVGAACAYEAARAGLDVLVVERGAIASGTTGAGEGNVLLSDKAPGPELDLALRSAQRWLELGDELPGSFELEPKGGVVTAWAASGLAALRALAAEQATAGVVGHDVSDGALWDLEPALSRGLAGGVHYPGDLQVQPMLACAALLAGARARGARVVPRCDLLGVERADDGRVRGVRTSAGDVACGALVNAAGAWSASVAALAGAHLDVRPRRGFILVTEPVPPTVFHKVYAAEYVGDVASAAEGLQASPVVEGTLSGTVLIGASRELAGFDATMPVAVLARLAAGAVRLFPSLAGVRVMRAYRGFRPFSADHLPVVGEDPEVPGLWHACGHEGAGIGLAPGTAEVLVAGLTGATAPVDGTAFSPARFAAAGLPA